jgi:hypothetical protein
MMGDFTGMVVAVAFWMCVAACIVGPSYFRHRERRNMQDILRVAYEKGQPVSPELISAMQSNLLPKPGSTRDGDLRRGIVLIALGIGMCGLGYGLWYGLSSVDDTAAYISGGCTAGAGAIPGMIGIAYIILWATGSKTPKASQTSKPSALTQS